MPPQPAGAFSNAEKFFRFPATRQRDLAQLSICVVVISCFSPLLARPSKTGASSAASAHPIADGRSTSAGVGLRGRQQAVQPWRCEALGRCGGCFPKW